MLTPMIYVLSFKAQKYRQHDNVGYALFCFTYEPVLLVLSVLINRIHTAWFNFTNM